MALAFLVKGHHRVPPISWLHNHDAHPERQGRNIIFQVIPDGGLYVYDMDNGFTQSCSKPSGWMATATHSALPGVQCGIRAQLASGVTVKITSFKAVTA